MVFKKSLSSNTVIQKLTSILAHKQCKL